MKDRKLSKSQIYVLKKLQKNRYGLIRYQHAIVQNYVLGKPTFIKHPGDSFQPITPIAFPEGKKIIAQRLKQLFRDENTSFATFIMNTGAIKYKVVYEWGKQDQILIALLESTPDEYESYINAIDEEIRLMAVKK